MRKRVACCDEREEDCGECISGHGLIWWYWIWCLLSSVCRHFCSRYVDVWSNGQWSSWSLGALTRLERCLSHLIAAARSSLTHQLQPTHSWTSSPCFVSWTKQELQCKNKSNSLLRIKILVGDNSRSLKSALGRGFEPRLVQALRALVTQWSEWGSYEAPGFAPCYIFISSCDRTPSGVFFSKWPGRCTKKFITNFYDLGCNSHII